MVTPEPTEPAKRDEQAIGQFIERFAAILVQAGFAPMAARVFVALLATDAGALTASDLSALLAASPAAISGAVRYLAQLGLITREREPGSRRDVYRVRDDVWTEVSARQDQVLDRWADAAREGIRLLGRQTPAGERMAESLDFLEFVQGERPAMMARWREHRRQQRERAR
ncbi:MAG: MarR family transcriptional regulator [Actinobacteria bacterium]|nr:MarR family transcriptional regulator [Actinomycetota bacterium]MBO0785185.1 MarR family transcriptional regulator [Actinomycetota bacterium]